MARSSWALSSFWTMTIGWKLLLLQLLLSGPIHNGVVEGAAASNGRACRACPAPLGLLASFRRSDVVAQVKVQRQISNRQGIRRYRALVQTVFKTPCRKNAPVVTTAETIILSTPTSPLACGTNFAAQTSYLVTGDFLDADDAGSDLSVTTCRFIMRHNQLSSPQRLQLQQLAALEPACPVPSNSTTNTTTGNTTVCTPELCGPAPGAPNFICPDNVTIAGPGPCSVLPTGQCGYPFVTCPTPSPTPPPPTASPTVGPCTPQTCGPRPLAPNFLCPDGVTVGGPSANCTRLPNGKCGYAIIRCPSCRRSSDCKAPNTYCSLTSGTCRAVGTCQGLSDCFNPHNTYISITCVGYIQCTSRNVCGKTCTTDGSTCPPQRPPSTTCAPCAATTCLTNSSCFEYKCGSCAAFCYDL